MTETVGGAGVSASGGSMTRMILQTEGLVLRPFAAGDGPAFHEYMSDPEVTRHSSLPPISLE